jgi:serine/threonine protein phosphatase PrpC
LADEYTCEAQVGDIVVCATDGVFDNLFNHEVLEIIKRFKESQYSKKQVEMPESQGLPCHLNTYEEANELAKLIVEAARAKVDE